MGETVVVTGMGVRTALGADPDTMFEALCRGDSAVAPIRDSDLKLRRKVAAQIPADKLRVPACWWGHGRGMQLVLAAAEDALAAAGLLNTCYVSGAGVVIGTMFGSIGEIEEHYAQYRDKGLAGLDRGILRRYRLHSLADHVAAEFGLSGPRLTCMTACASGTTAIGLAMDWIRRGRARIVLTGGVDAFRILTHIGMSGYRIIAPDAPRPFDLNRKGLVVGEGSGLLVIEDAVSARNRGANPLCRLAGFGMSSEAHDLASPRETGEGMALSMQRAMDRAGIAETDIGYINAHGTGTPKNDVAEVAAFKMVFGQHAYRMAVSSSKSSLGHAMGGAGGIEAVISVLSLVRGMVPPTINYRTPDPDCDLDVVPNVGRSTSLRAVMSNSFGFGGNNASLVFTGIPG